MDQTLSWELVWSVTCQGFTLVLGFPCLNPCVRAKSLQRCLTLRDPMDCSLPNFSVHGDFPDKNTGVGCHAFLQGIFPAQGSNPGLLRLLIAGRFFTTSATWGKWLMRLYVFLPQRPLDSPTLFNVRMSSFSASVDSFPTNLVFIPSAGKTFNGWVFSATGLWPSNQVMLHNQLFRTCWILAAVRGASLLELGAGVGAQGHCENPQGCQVPTCRITHGASATSLVGFWGHRL